MRKFIAVALTLALVLGTLPLSGLAASVGPGQKLKDIAGNANEEAIQVAYDLGIVEGTPEGNYEPTKAVNRAEFAALITRALATPKSAIDSYTTTSFRDTDGYGWAVGYLAFCQQKGIMKGNGYGDAMPGRTITANEAVTMVLRALGYTDNASVLVGQWPANYVSLAQNQQLYDKVTAEGDINKAAAAQIVYNALTAQLVQVDANALVTKLYDVSTDAQGYRVEVPRSLLTTNHNCEYIGKHIITYNDAAKASINLTPNVGAFAVLYRSKTTDKYVAVTEIETTFLAGKFTTDNKTEATADSAGNYRKYKTVNKFKTIDGVEYTLTTTDKEILDGAPSEGAVKLDGGKKEIAIFNNGNDGIPSGGWAEYVKGTEAGNAKVIIAGKINGKAITELYSVAIWDASGTNGTTFLWDTDSLNSAKDKINTYELPKDDFGEVDANAYILVGADSLEAIQKDNVVYLYRNSNKKISRIEVGTGTQSGKITNINDADKEYTIGGKVIGKAPYDGGGISDLNVINNEGTAYLDYYSRIYEFKLGEASKGTFGVVTGSTWDGWGKAVIKLFDNTGKEVTYEVKDTFSGTEQSPETKYTNATANAPNLVEYKLSGGKISDLSVVTLQRVVKDANGNAAGVFGHINAAGTLLTKVHSDYSGNKNININSGVLVYIKDGSDYSLGSINDIKDKDLESPFQYILKDGNVAALLVDSDDAGASTVYIMVNKLQAGAKGDDTVDIIRGLSFNDKLDATTKSWTYTDSNFRNELETAAATLYPNYAAADKLADFKAFPEIVKFRVTDDNVLKKPTLIDTADNKRLAASYGSDGPVGVQYADYRTGALNTFEYVVSATETNNWPVEVDAVLYYKDGSNWAVQKPTKGYFESNKADGRYILLTTDKDKGAQIIIRIDQ
jgi:hypothetical protein